MMLFADDWPDEVIPDPSQGLFDPCVLLALISDHLTNMRRLRQKALCEVSGTASDWC